jgi:hypothetical protein
MKAKKDGNKSFKDWTYEEVNNTFGLKRVFEHSFFDTLKTFHLSENHELRKKIEQLRKSAMEYIETWNEDEYKFFFISPFIGLVDFSSAYYKAFTQRPLSLSYENGTKTTEGLVEFMLAKGLQTPRCPHFFLHEYKPEKRKDNDPLGQLLIGMVAAKKLNQDDKPIYGIYLNGRNWFLVLLEDEQYAVSNPYVATSNDIFDLFAVLLFFKDEMEKLYQEI